MANGLRVVSIRIPAIETSAVGKYMYYYEDQTPENIAKTITEIDFNDGYNGKEVISDLDNNFSKELYTLIKDIENDN